MPHRAGSLEDLGAERHDGAQQGQEPEDEEHARRLHAPQPLKLDQERHQELLTAGERGGATGETRGRQSGRGSVIRTRSIAV